MKNSISPFFRKPRRWIILLLAVVVLHLAVIEWIRGHMGFSGSRDASADSLISATLSEAPPQQQASSTPSTHESAADKNEPSTPETQPKEEAPAPSSVLPADTPVSASGTATPTLADSKNASNAGSATSAQEASNPGVGLSGSPQPASPPPSAKLEYQIQASKQGRSVFGKGYIDWKNDGTSFTLNGESSLLFITVFNFHSEGTISQKFGISPTLYTEKRFRKPETNTHFHRERNVISFSASTLSYPRNGGEQDRSSVVWQLAGIGRRDSATFKRGGQIAIFVAGTRDAEIWYFDILGLEDVETEEGKMQAWHLVRKARPGSYDQTLEIWLAPQKEWYPVKLRHTDKNGDNLDMTLSGIKTAAAR